MIRNKGTGTTRATPTADDLGRPGSVVAQHHNPRSYTVFTDQGTVRRNRSHLVNHRVTLSSMTPKTPTPVPRAASPAVSGLHPRLQNRMALPQVPLVGPKWRGRAEQSFHQRNLTFRLLYYRLPMIGYNTP
ncbi:hypothetical protein ElyMa_004660800 [Elysia marginata]|uniref:Uncharacterized protein n=1 Tax=Elysia marginata TaxID=1093978 RepID=A0AAV4I4U0_9GAST|nr:hypothetical protein ElyMa_004660800 [Elysia marginata]